MEYNETTSSVTQAAEEDRFDPKDYPSLIKKIFGNFRGTELLVTFAFLVIVGAWWFIAYNTYELDVFRAISFLYAFSPMVIILNNVFIYSAVILVIFLPGHSKRLICSWLNRADKLNIKKHSEKGKRIHEILEVPNKFFRLIAVSTLLGIIGVGVGWHILKNMTPLESPVNPFYSAWMEEGIVVREFVDGPIPSIMHTIIVMIGFAVGTFYAIEMWDLIYALRVVSGMISDDLAQREINPYHSDRMGGLKPYSSTAILLATYNTIPYILMIPFITQYVTTKSWITQLISIGLIATIPIGLGVIMWIMMAPLNSSLKRFKVNFDQKVYEAIDNPRFGHALNMVLSDGTSPPPEDGVFFSAALSLWGVAAVLKTSALDIDEIKKTLIKIAAPVAGFLANYIFQSLP